MGRVARIEKRTTPHCRQRPHVERGPYWPRAAKPGRKIAACLGPSTPDPSYQQNSGAERREQAKAWLLLSTLKLSNTL